jgi:glyoxylase-like metal-dependent hydrolase (beta-lactamase superfamily II)
MDLRRIRLPLPLKLAELNAYLISGPGGHALVDTGMATAAAREALHAALAGHGLEVSDLRQVFVTHFHGDHWGLAPFLQASGARVLMPRIDHELLQLWFHHPEYDRDAVAGFRELGVPDAVLARAARALSGMRAVSPRLAADATVEDGEVVELAGVRFRVIITPGHTPGHACLESLESRDLIAGDHVLPQITPNISRDLGLLDDPLSAYRGALASLRGRGYETAWPAHGEPMHALDRRIDEILAHHRERADKLLGLLDARAPRRILELCGGLFELGRLDDWESWMALGETRAHLRALETEGRARSGPDAAGVTSFWRTGP